NRTKVDVDKELKRLLDQTPILTQSALAALQRADAELERDPAFLADYLKDRFIEDILRMMERLEINQAELARRIGKSPQYLSKILNRAKPSNFTIQTMTEMSCALGLSMS